MNAIVKIMLLIVGMIAIFSGCAPDLNRRPDKWVTIRDIDTNMPVSGVPLVYTRTTLTPIIIGFVSVSREYISGADGRAYVPSGERLSPRWHSGYELSFSDELRGSEEKSSVIYVRRVDVIGDWGAPVNGLRCRLAIGVAPPSDDRWANFRLELQNVSEVIKYVYVNRMGFGRITTDSDMLWISDNGNNDSGYRTLQPCEIISTEHFLPEKPIYLFQRGKFVYTGTYSNTISTSNNNYPTGDITDPVKLWIGTETVHKIKSAPVEISY